MPTHPAFRLLLLPFRPPLPSGTRFSRWPLIADPSLFTLTLHTHPRFSRLRIIKPQKRTIRISSKHPRRQRRLSVSQARDFAALTGDSTLGIPKAKTKLPKQLRWRTPQSLFTAQNHAKSGAVCHSSGHIRAYDSESKPIRMKRIGDENSTPSP